jgi:hypothetical protein
VSYVLGHHLGIHSTRAPASPPATDATNPMTAHEPRHPMGTNPRECPRPKVSVNARTLVPAGRLVVTVPTHSQHRLTLLRTAAERLPTPRLRPAACPRHHPSQHRDRIPGHFLLDEGIPHRYLPAKKPPAFLDVRSIRNCSIARQRAWSSYEAWNSFGLPVSWSGSCAASGLTPSG